jgi:hypothetical protein
MNLSIAVKNDQCRILRKVRYVLVNIGGYMLKANLQILLRVLLFSLCIYGVPFTGLFPGYILVAQKIIIGPAELLYPDSRVPFYVDASFATLKKNSTEINFFHTAFHDTYKYYGPPDDPLKKMEWKRKDSVLYDMQGYEGVPWLMNIYKCNNGDLLGFIHLEINTEVKGKTVLFRFGVAYSTNNGDKWVYCGNIVKTQSGSGNMGGVPYLVVGDYFYVYFNEFPVTGGKRLCVARAKQTEVIAAAAKGTVTKWMKFNNGKWDEDALTGLGSNIIPVPVETDTRYDLHSDAAYCTPLRKYMITVQTHSIGQLLLFLSSDGINWGEKIIVDETPDNNYIQAYSCFVGLEGADDVCSVVGNEFYIYTPRKDWPKNYPYDEYYRHKVTITGN